MVAAALAGVAALASVRARTARHVGGPVVALRAEPPPWYDPPPMLLAGAVIVLLILLTALYVAAEFAAVGAGAAAFAGWLRTETHSRRGFSGRRGPARARPLYRRLADRHHAVEPDPRRLRTGTLAPRFAPLLDRSGSTASAESTAAVSRPSVPTLAVIIGELVPKSSPFRIRRARALVTVLPMQWSLRLFMVDRVPERQRRAAAETDRRAGRRDIGTCTRPKKLNC